MRICFFATQSKIFKNINCHFIWIECDCSKFLTNERQQVLKEKALSLGYSDFKHTGYVIVANKPVKGRKGVVLNKVNLLVENLGYYETEDLTTNKSIYTDELYFISRVMNEIELDWN